MGSEAVAAGGTARRGSRGKDKPTLLEDDCKKRGMCMLALRRAMLSMRRIFARITDCVVGSSHVWMRILGPCLICLALALIGFCTYTYFAYVLPNLRSTRLEQCLETSVGVFLLANTLYNYGCSVLMDAGTPPEYDAAVADAGLRLEEAEDLPKQCPRCTRVKPARCHHCSVCRRCVMKMDHHCPWINNCVGHRNYRHFCLFLLFLSMTCLFGVMAFAVPYADSLVFGGFRAFRRRLPREGRQSILTSAMICISIIVALAILGGFHVYLVLSNQTTIEFQINWNRRAIARQCGEHYRNPYDLGRTRNFQQVFGPNPMWGVKWMLPYLSRAPTGDGMDYPSMSRFRAV